MTNNITPTIPATPQSTTHYKRIVELTCKITGIQAPPAGYDPWESLVRIWALYHAELQCEDLLYATLHSLKWGIYPRSEDDPLRWAFNKGTPMEDDTAELLALFREELTTPGAGGAIALHRWKDFKYVYYSVNEDDEGQNAPAGYSITHLFYLEERFNHLVHSFDPTDQRWAGYKEFEKNIMFLLPDSIGWREEEWLNEAFILHELDQTFHTNYSNNPHCLDDVVKLAAAARAGTSDVKSILMNLTELSYALALHIWPVDTIGQVTTAYGKVIKEARVNERNAKRRKSGKLRSCEFGFADVKTTGIHKLMKDLVSLKMLNDIPTKKLVFSMELQ